MGLQPSETRGATHDFPPVVEAPAVAEVRPNLGKTDKERSAGTAVSDASAQSPVSLSLMALEVAAETTHRQAEPVPDEVGMVQVMARYMDTVAMQRLAVAGEVAAEVTGLWGATAVAAL